MRLVVDASVAIKWIVEEEGRQAARQLLLGEHEFLAPEFLLIETANILRTKVTKGIVFETQALPGLEMVRAAIPHFVSDRDLAGRALEMALTLMHPVYDCMYLACAERNDAEFITADMKLSRKLAGIGGFPRAHALSHSE